jgi:hypothetical protein
LPAVANPSSGPAVGICQGATKEIAMKFKLIMMAAVVASVPVLGLDRPAHAIIADSGLKAPTLTEDVACRFVRTRIVHPNGAVTFRNVRRCGLVAAVRGCKVIRERVVRPSGAVVFRTIRRCV